MGDVANVRIFHDDLRDAGRIPQQEKIDRLERSLMMQPTLDADRLADPISEAGNERPGQ